jgi:hypothetical protein
VQHEGGPGSVSFRAVNNVWQTRCRVLVEQLEALAHRLRDKQPIPPPALDEQAVRLLNGGHEPSPSPQRSSQPSGSSTKLTMPSWTQVTTTTDQHCLTLSCSRWTALTSLTVPITHISALPGVELLHFVRAEAKSLVIMVSLAVPPEGS